MNNKPYKCIHCGRNIGDMVPHVCRGTIRKRNLIFKDRRTGVIYQKGFTEFKDENNNEK